MSNRQKVKHDRRSYTGHYSNEAPSRHMPRPTVSSEHWENGFYYGMIRRHADGAPIGGGEYAVISITATDETARHDWREFQQLKNWLVGPEWEALEMYPAESRLLDPSNRFYLWCFRRNVIPWGAPEGARDVRHPRDAIAPQRAFPAPTWIDP